MNDSAARLHRLHALRCRMADGAVAERKRITQKVSTAEQAIALLRVTMETAMRESGSMERNWSEQQALLQVAAGQSRGLHQRCADLAVAQEQAIRNEHAAVLAREQTGRMLEQLQTQMEKETSRREQARLDDLFLTTHVRARMITAF